MSFLPVCKKDVESLGWDYVDFVYVSGDAYVDHPSFGVAIISRILEAKGYVEHRRQDGTGRTFVYSPLLTRERYVTCVLRDVKETMFGSSVKKMLSFFVQHEDISNEELQEILELIDDTNDQTL